MPLPLTVIESDAPFVRGDRVKHPTWGDVVLTVTSCEPHPRGGFYVRAERTWMAQSCNPNLSPRECVDGCNDAAEAFTLYRPMRLPKVRPIPAAEIAELDSSIIRAELLARALSTDGERSLQAAE